MHLRTIALFTGLTIAAFAAHAQTYPSQGETPVTDDAEIIDAVEEAKLAERIIAIEQQSGADVAVVTLPATQFYTMGDDLDVYTQGLMEEWQLGSTTDGKAVLLLVFRDDRELRLEVTGAGDDASAAAQKVIDEAIVPRFREDDFGGGISLGVEGIANDILMVGADAPVEEAQTILDDLIEKTRTFYCAQNIGAVLFVQSSSEWSVVGLGEIDTAEKLESGFRLRSAASLDRLGYLEVASRGWALRLFGPEGLLEAPCQPIDEVVERILSEDAIQLFLRAREIQLAQQIASLTSNAKELSVELLAALDRQASTLEALDRVEAARLAESVAAEALRERLANAGAELTATTLALEEQRRETEEALTFLAAAEAVADSLELQVADALLAYQALEAELSESQASLEEVRQALDEVASRAGLSESEAQSALANAVLALQVRDEELAASIAAGQEAYAQIATLEERLDMVRSANERLRGDIAILRQTSQSLMSDRRDLSAQLTAALARANTEERQRRRLEEEARIQAEAEAARLQAEAQDLERYRSEFFGRLRDVVADLDGIRIVGDRFVFSSEVLFEPGAAKLSASGRAEIANVARILTQISDEIPPEIDWIIWVDGHTDNIPLSGFGEHANNWELSQARALSVVLYMIRSEGIDPRRLAANGFGEFQPISTEDTNEARAQNRRIELKLTER